MLTPWPALGGGATTRIPLHHHGHHLLLDSHAGRSVSVCNVGHPCAGGLSGGGGR
jgi:hypothetical protein